MEKFKSEIARTVDHISLGTIAQHSKKELQFLYYDLLKKHRESLGLRLFQYPVIQRCTLCGHQTGAPEKPCSHGAEHVYAETLEPYLLPR